MRSSCRPVLLALLLCPLLAACGPETARGPEEGAKAPAAAATPPGPAPAVTGERRPWIVVGIDGGEWKIVRELWQRGRLPHFRTLAERGVSAELQTKYTASPIIWTTIATGVTPDVHGITGFVIPTDEGDVPVSSTLRRAPALWNMLGYTKRNVAVLGWWASWPAEEVPGGIVVSDRATLGVPDRVTPASFLARVDDARERAEAAGLPFTSERDRLNSVLVRELAGDLARGDLDLLLSYFHGVDVVSHRYFKYYRPQVFDPPPTPEEIVEHGEVIPNEYQAVDEVLGALLEIAPDANLLVISDHGFHASRPEDVRVLIHLDDLLDRLGYRDPEDLESSRLYTFASEDFRRARWMRFGDAVPEAEKAGVRAAFERDLARITYANGEPAFRVRDAGPKDHKIGPVDFVVIVRQAPATEDLLLDGDPEPLRGVIRDVSRLSGTHGEHTDGIFLAAGPNVDPAADLTGIRIHDVTPTLLYGLGLPVGDDFAGRAWTELFAEPFRRRHNLRTVASWQPALDRGESRVTRSAEDEALLEELGALGYIE
jgi:predicted AlkP superfamily phosphohydrolase/phosphomutase